MALKSVLPSVLLIFFADQVHATIMTQISADGVAIQKTSASLPAACSVFFKSCGMELPGPTVQAVSHQFSICCAHGGHKKTTCQDLASEALDGDANHIVNDFQCKCLQDLFITHTDWKRGKQSLLQKTPTPSVALMRRSQTKGNKTELDATIWPKPAPAPAPSLCNHGEVETFTCSCNAGYTGKACGTICSGHGSILEGKCQCQTGWTGTTCADCDLGYSGINCDVQCTGHGTLSDGVCTCSTGFKGSICEDCEWGHSGADCSLLCNGHGNLTNGACHCNAEWEGQLCENHFSGHCYEIRGTKRNWGNDYFIIFECKVWKNGNDKSLINGEISVNGSEKMDKLIQYNYGDKSVKWEAPVSPYCHALACPQYPSLPPANNKATVSCVIPAEPSSCSHCVSKIDPVHTSVRHSAEGHCTAYDAGQHNGLFLSVPPALFPDGTCKMCRSQGYSCTYGYCSMSPPCDTNCGSNPAPQGEQCRPQGGTQPVTVSQVCPGPYNGLAYSPMTYGWGIVDQGALYGFDTL